MQEVSCTAAGIPREGAAATRAEAEEPEVETSGAEESFASWRAMRAFSHLSVHNRPIDGRLRPFVFLGSLCRWLLWRAPTELDFSFASAPNNCAIRVASKDATAAADCE